MVILRHMAELISFEHYLAMLSQPALLEEYSVVSDRPCLCVSLTGHETETLPVKLRGRLPACPVIGVSAYADRLPQRSPVDLCVTELEAEQVIGVIDAQPLACAALVQLLRHNEAADLSDGLLAESMCYSMLQQSTGFQRWLRERGQSTSRTDSEPPLLTNQQDGVLQLTLNRPHVHNAYSMALKDELCAVLATVYANPQIECVRLSGNGPSFCAGGDLSEFGQVTDAASAHHSRVTRSAGALLARLPCRSEAHLHGACIGAGIEVPAFADHVSAGNDSYFQLPEIAMGLVPGAGGTVSISARIGRQRTNWLAISNQRLDAPTALAWQLIDAIDG